MEDQLLRYDDWSFGRPYHPVLVESGPGASRTGMHGHCDFYEFMAIMSGDAEHQLETGQQVLQAGDVVFIRPRDKHAISGLAPRGVKFINVTFPASAWRSFSDISGVDPDGAWEHAAAPPIFTFRDAEFVRVKAIFRTALRSFYGNPTMLDLTLFWSDLLKLAAAGQHSATSAGPRPPAWLSRACTAMRREENLRSGVLRLQELAMVSAAHLSRSMRQHYDQTPTAFVTELRLQHAASLLATSDVPVTEIAMRCGFTSPSYFTRCFHAAHKISPRVYRQRNRRAFVP